jgi:hypothetical protein
MRENREIFHVFSHVFIGTKTGEPGEIEEQDVPSLGIM